MIASDKLVAHRGDPFSYPENTLNSIRSAIQTGATWVEIDVQYTADFTPVLYHDPDFKRLSGDPRELLTLSWDDVKPLPASHPERFGDKFDSNSISRFTELLDSLADWPQVQIFVELKSTPIDHFGVNEVASDIVKKIIDANCHDQIAAIISKHDLAMEAVRAQSDIPIGWVAPDYDEAKGARAKQLNFDYLFIANSRFNAWQQGLPRQSEQRVVYTINELETAYDLLKAGADMIETDLIGKLLSGVEK